MDFFLSISGKVEGPFTADEVGDLHGKRLIDRKTPCRRAESQQWLTVYDLVPTALWVTHDRTGTLPPSVAVAAKPTGSTNRYGPGPAFFSLPTDPHLRAIALTAWICYVAAILTCWVPFVGAVLFLAVIIFAVACLFKDETKHGIALLLCGLLTPAILFTSSWPQCSEP